MPRRDGAELQEARIKNVHRKPTEIVLIGQKPDKVFNPV
jgi:hypothetical protein